MNVYDQAHGLAQAIKESEEFKQYSRLKSSIDANEELSKMVKDFQAKQCEVQAKQMMGESVGPEVMNQVQELYQIMGRDPLAAKAITAPVAAPAAPLEKVDWYISDISLSCKASCFSSAKFLISSNPIDSLNSMFFIRS